MESMPFQTQASIRPATSADIPLILQRLSEMPNPPYQEDVQALLDDEWEFIFVNEASGEVCRVALSEKAETSCIVWMLPLRRSRGTQLRELVRGAERAAVAKHPEAKPWKHYARFQWRRKDGSEVVADKGEALCYHFGAFWSGTVVKRLGVDGKPDPDGEAEISITLGVAAK